MVHRPPVWLVPGIPGCTASRAPWGSLFLEHEIQSTGRRVQLGRDNTEWSRFLTRRINLLCRRLKLHIGQAYEPLCGQSAKCLGI